MMRFVASFKESCCWSLLNPALQTAESDDRESTFPGPDMSQSGACSVCVMGWASTSIVCWYRKLTGQSLCLQYLIFSGTLWSAQTRFTQRIRA
jgi:hypothetical protein